MKTTTERESEKKAHNEIQLWEFKGNTKYVAFNKTKGRKNKQTHTHQYADDNDDDRVIVKFLFSNFSMYFIHKS